MKEDTFDKVLAMLPDQLYVTQIMVTKPDFCTKRDNPSTILGIMHQNNYDIMPVKEHGKFVGYVERSLLVKMKQIEPAIQQITLDIVVSADTCVHEMIDLFRKSRFFFVNRANDLVGLVTYVDLDKFPVRVWLFILISKFEFLLLQLIKNFYKGSTWLDELTSTRRRKIIDLFDEKRKPVPDSSISSSKLAFKNRSCVHEFEFRLSLLPFSKNFLWKHNFFQYFLSKLNMITSLCYQP